MPGEEGGHVYYGRRGIEMQQEEEEEEEEEGESTINSFLPMHTWGFLQWLKSCFVQSRIAGRIEARESPGKRPLCIVSLVFLILLILKSELHS